MITGAQLFVKALKAENVEVLFAYPGGQAIDLFDALYDNESIILSFRATNRDLLMRRTAMPVLRDAPAYAL